MPPIKHSPAVLGSDISGVIYSVGSDVRTSAPGAGTRVTAFCPTFNIVGDPDFGAFQEFALVPEQNICPIPDHVTFNGAATLPMSVGTTW